MLINMSELYEQMTDNDNEENNQLCENMDCRRFPPDWDFDLSLIHISEPTRPY